MGNDDKLFLTRAEVAGILRGGQLPLGTETISDRSDLQPAVTLWPSSQVPQFLLKSEQPSDLRMTEE